MVNWMGFWTGCGHRFCMLCMERHGVARLRDGGRNYCTCLHAGCPRLLSLAQLHRLMSTKSFQLLTTRLVESAIPDHEKAYCPYCSTLFVGPYYSPYTSAYPLPILPVKYIECENCHSGFCVECAVPWHGDGSWAEYKGHLNDKQCMPLHGPIELARSQDWKHCKKCHYTGDHAASDRHMTCR